MADGANWQPAVESRKDNSMNATYVTAPGSIAAACDEIHARKLVRKAATLRGTLNDYGICSAARVAIPDGGPREMTMADICNVDVGSQASLNAIPKKHGYHQYALPEAAKEQTAARSRRSATWLGNWHSGTLCHLAASGSSNSYNLDESVDEAARAGAVFH
jgi:hypothetical protein